MSEDNPITKTVIDNTITEECVPDPDTALWLFVIFCFFAVVIMTTVRTYRKGPPSVTTLGSQSFMSIFSCFILIGIGFISVYAEWVVMIAFVLAILFFMIGVLEPEIFFYSKTS